METTKTKVYGYIRVSTTDQSNSLEVQEKRINEYCAFKHLQLVEIFIDEGVSGYTPLGKRPEGSKLVALLTKETKAVVAVKPDRLFRSTIDSLTMVNSWDKMDIELHMVDMNGATLATKTATGKMLFTILIAFSQFERDITGERIKVVLNNKKATGKPYAGHLFGFDKVGGDLIKGKLVNQELVKNESEQSIIEIIKKHKDELSPAKIADKLNGMGLRAKKGGKFFPSTVLNVLSNSIYQ